QTLGPFASRVQWIKGYVDDAPAGPFDGATCLLTLHFLSRPERLHLLRALRERMKPGAPLIVAHHANPQGGEVEPWLTRSAAFAAGTRFDFSQACASAAGMAQHLTLLSPNEEEAML